MAQSVETGKLDLTEKENSDAASSRMALSSGGSQVWSRTHFSICSFGATPSFLSWRMEGFPRDSGYPEMTSALLRLSLSELQGTKNNFLRCFTWIFVIQRQLMKTQEIKNVTKPGGGGGGGAGIRNSPAPAVTFFGSVGAINTSSSGGLSPRLKKGGGVTRFIVRPSVDGFAFFRLPRIVIPDSRLEMLEMEILDTLSTY